MAGILNATGDLAISYTSSYFQPHADQVSKSIRFVGWAVDETQAEIPDWFAKIQGRKLIYVSLGTLISNNPTFFKACIDAFRDTDYFVVMSTGNRISPESFDSVPDNIVIQSWVPQIFVLKRASLFVTHAGLNSVHDGLYLGVPLLLVPQQAEQTFTAMRVAELGAGLILTKAQTAPEAIRVSARRLLGEPSFKQEAEHIAASLHTGGGIPRAVDEIEQLLVKKRSN
jgi:MGT family glycosyltransferase